MNNKYTVGDIFAGVGGLSKAFEQAGAEIVWANELDSNLCNIYKENFSNGYLSIGDIKEVEAKNIPSFDILISGFPCQSFSVSGKVNGFDDERETLFFHILRMLKQKKPRVVFLENSKSLKLQNGGISFKIITEALENEGYYIKYTVLNSKEYGNIPHNKERMYIVGFKDLKEYDMFEFPEKIKLTTMLNNIIDLKKEKDKRYYNAKSIKYLKESKLKIVPKDNVFVLRHQQNKSERYRIAKYDICPALTSYINSSLYIPLIKDDFNIRMLTPSECFKIQGYFDIKIPTKISDNKLYKYAVNCSSVTVVKRIAKNIITVLDLNKQNMGINMPFFNGTENLFDEIQQKTPINNEVEAIKENIVINEIREEVSVKNEKEFILQKVIPALKNKDFFDVRYNHGIDEYGKDVTYKYYDNFGSLKYGSAQVKYGDISGNVKGDIYVILSQIEDAFNMPFVDIKESRKNYVNQLLVICSGKYTRNAKEKIVERLKKGYDIRFFDGQDIDNLLE